MLTSVDGDGRGGAALSMRAVTGKPIKLMGTGEKIDALEDFDPARIAGRILGMGDVVGLVEKAIADRRDRQGARRSPRKMRKGAFDLDDLAEQLKQMQKLGGMGGVLGMLPGVGKIKKQLDIGQARRRHPEAPAGDHRLDDARRAQEPEAAQCLAQEARGVGFRHRSVQDINKLVKMHRQMADMMKAMGKKRGLLGAAVRRRIRRLSFRPNLPAGVAPPPASPASRRADLPGLGGGCRAAFLDCPACPGVFPACQDRRNDGSSKIREGCEMSLKIRLARAGAKKRPYYRIVVADSKEPARRPPYREARHLQSAAAARLGRARQARRGPHQALARASGAQPTDRVLRFLDKAGMAKRDARSNPNKGQPGKKRARSARRRRSPPLPKKGQGGSRSRCCIRRRRQSLLPRPSSPPPNSLAGKTGPGALGEIGRPQGLQGRGARFGPITAEPGAIAAYGPLGGRDRHAPVRDRVAARHAEGVESRRLKGVEQPRAEAEALTGTASSTSPLAHA